MPVALVLTLLTLTAAAAEDLSGPARSTGAHTPGSPDRRERIEFTSTADASAQPAYLIVPEQARTGGRLPLVVSLHSWSADMEQRNAALEELVYRRGWFYLFPDFRGANTTPDALASPLAQQDILDAVDWVCSHHAIDENNIFITGISGGGHMTMMMVARYPQRWTAASAWVGISDLVSWHEQHKGDRYGDMMEQCCGGAPGDSLAIDRQYSQRSPISYLANAKDVAIDIAAGVHDGHSGSVPVRHSIDAFNAIATAVDATPVSEEEIEQISRKNGRLRTPQPDDVGFDQAFGRRYYLRRTAADARLTVFEGGHEGIAPAAMAWFEEHRRE